MTQATPELLGLAASILNPQPHATLVLVDAEHFTAELLDQVHAETDFDLLVPMPQQPSLLHQLRAIPPEQFTRHWAGYATARLLTNARASGQAMSLPAATEARARLIEQRQALIQAGLLP